MRKNLLFISYILVSNLFFSQNRLTNAGFENWSGNYLTNWTGNNNAFAVDVNKVNVSGTTGNYSAKLIMPNGVNNGAHLVQYFNLDNDDVDRKYLLTFKMMYLSDPTKIALNVRVTDSFGSIIDSNPFYPIQNGQFVINQWITIQREFMKPIGFTGTNSKINIFLASNIQNSTTERSVIIEDFSITKVPNLSTSETSSNSDLHFTNPIKNNLSIHTAEKIEKIEIYSLSGQLVKFFNSVETNVSDLNKGIYILKVKTNKKTYNQKLIKE